MSTFNDDELPMGQAEPLGEDHDPTDETQDFRFLTSAGGKIPKRGEKDFESHGTRHQGGVLEASRQAMHDALSYTRVHAPHSNHVHAWFFGDGSMNDEEKADVFSEHVRGRGLTEDHTVMVENATGTAFKTMGKASLGLKNTRLWLLPEEALYLIDRGGMDLWWPARPQLIVRGQRGSARKASDLEATAKDDSSDDDEGLPLSLQTAYALLIGQDGEKGKIDLDAYTVYSNLKRAGYAVVRASEEDPSQKLSSTIENKSIFTWLFQDYFGKRSAEHTHNGPLVRPGLYRSYNEIYHQLSIIPRHQSAPHISDPVAPAAPFKVVFNIWKASRLDTFAKTNPGLPDFRIAIVSSRSTAVPSLAQMTTLLSSTPWDPPDPSLTGPTKSYPRLKHGFRNVILAVVDQGITSYLRLSEGAFGEEKVYERFDRGGGGQRGKHGGQGRGRGGRGRGRGRGRGS